MKVVAIMGSPHKGKGYEIIKKVESQLKLMGDVDFEYIFLSDVNLEMCKGCFNCISKGEIFCPLKDDRDIIEQKILESDGVILSSPGYAWNVSGLMKNFIDRFAYSLHRPKFFNQSLMLIANGGSGLKRVIKAMSTTLGGSMKTCELCVTSTPWEDNQNYKLKIEKAIKCSTRKFYDSMKYRKKTNPPLGNVIWFKMFKKMASLSKEALPADHKYYSDKHKYFYETEVNPFKSFIADAIADIAIWSMKKMIVFK